MATNSTTFLQAGQLSAKMKSAVQADTDGVATAIKAVIPKGDKGDPGAVWRGAFAASTAYAVGDLYTSGGQTYRVKTAHTSSAAPDFTKADMFAAKGNDGTGSAGAATIKEWAASTAYAADETVSYSGELYKAKTAFTSGATFDATKWTRLTRTGSTVAVTSGVTAFKNADGTIRLSIPNGTI